ncbi:MAG TPA: response regulator [Clostridiaceae bacterium]|nr:response regulator [Clostridiaceae bacterium]
MLILVVDDEMPARQSMVNMLNKLGYTNILEACDGIEAIDIIKTEKPSIVLADIRMPEMNGIDLLNNIKTFGIDTLFIFVSGYDLFEYAQKAVKLGAFNYLLKPLSIEELKEAMDSAVEHFNKTYKQTFNDLLRQLSNNINNKYVLENTVTLKENKSIISFKTEQELFHFFESNNFSSALALISNVYESFVSGDAIAVPNFSKLNLHFILLLYRILEQLNVEPENLLGDEFLLCNELNTLSTIETITEWYKSKLDICFNAINEKRDSANRKLIEKAKKYIKDNISMDITLESVSEHVHMSPSYFSKIFKDETGDNFVNYVSVYRVEIAKELLREGIYKSTEVGKMVGIHNTKYFYKLFKKITGLTPSQYRRLSI